jgi:hypothetical protein
MTEKDLPDLYVVFEASGEVAFTAPSEQDAEGMIGAAELGGSNVEGWIVRKYVPTRRYRLS